MNSPSRQPADAAVRLGLRENLGQFALLVVVNAFVGAMVGLERSILPAIAEQEFQLGAHMRRKGTGTATSHPATSTCLRPRWSESRPAP